MAAMLARDNVLDLQRRQRRMLLQESAILASIACSLPHPTARGGAYHSCGWAKSFLACACRIATNLFART